MAPAAKRKRISTHEDLEKSFLIWFINARERSVPVDGNMLVSKVESLSEIYTISSTPSCSWLQVWAKRNGISFGNDTENLPLLTPPLHMISSWLKSLQFWRSTHVKTYTTSMKWASSTNVYPNFHMNL